MQKLLALSLLFLSISAVNVNAQDKPDFTLAGYIARQCASVDTMGDAAKARWASLTESQRAATLLCEARIMGWREVIDALPVFVPDMSEKIHIDQAATNGQLIRVFIAYIKAHPQAENKPGLEVFYQALDDAGLIGPNGSSKAASFGPSQEHTYAELQPLLDNRCFRSKTPAEQKQWLQQIDETTVAEFKKDMDDLASINAADRSLGTRGCEASK